MESMERAIAAEDRKKKENRRFFHVPEGFGDFTDKQIKEFATQVYDSFVSGISDTLKEEKE